MELGVTQHLETDPPTPSYPPGTLFISHKLSVHFLKVRIKLVEGQSVRSIQETGAWHLSSVAEQPYLLGAVDRHYT